MKSFKIMALFVAVAVVGCFLFAGLLARILFGITDPTENLRHLIGQMAFVMGLSALLNVVVQFLVAQRRFIPASSTLVFAVAYLVSTRLFHATSGHIVLAAAVCNGGLHICIF